MKLGDFKSKTTGKNIRLSATVADTSGAKDYELAIAGPSAGIKKIFGSSDFSITIDPKGSAEDAQPEFGDDIRARMQEYDTVASLQDPSALPVFKKSPTTPTPANSVFVSLRRTRGQGTFWGPWIFPYVLPMGWNIFVFPPPLCALAATVAPVSGDQDIFLMGGFFFSTLLDASIRGGTAVDRVSFSNPPLTPCNLFTWKALMIRIFGFRAGAGTFTMRGFS